MAKYLLPLLASLLLLVSGCELLGRYDFIQDDDDPAAFPSVIALPNGFGPEGIVAGSGEDFYVGSLEGGAIYRGDFGTGEGSVLLPNAMGESAVGLDFDRRTGYLYVAGGGTGGAQIVDTRNGQVVARYDFGGGFVNDVIVGLHGAYFTDSGARRLYKIPLDIKGKPADTFTTIQLDDAFAFTEGEFNANGIELTPLGRYLIVANTFSGELYRIDIETGRALAINLGGESLPNADGILLRGRRLYVVQNFLNQVAVVDFTGTDYRVGQITNTLSNPDLRIPTTITHRGERLYVVNARFDVAPPGQAADDTEFEVVRVDE